MIKQALRIASSLLSENLDASQREALKFALLQKELAVIHGPPGTGKTTTVVEVVTQSVRSGCKVLCCAPSNVAVDNLLERLAANRLKVVRLGHPARVAADLQRHSLDAIISQSDQTQLVKDARSDIDKTLAQVKRARSKGERAGLWGRLKELRKEVNERERKAVKEILGAAEVVVSTLTSASLDGPLKQLPDNHFDITVIDECSQVCTAVAARVCRLVHLSSFKGRGNRLLGRLTLFPEGHPRRRPPSAAPHHHVFRGGQEGAREDAHGAGD